MKKLIKKLVVGVLACLGAITLMGILLPDIPSSDKEESLPATIVSEATPEPTVEPIPEPTVQPTVEPMAEPEEEKNEEVPNYFIPGITYEAIYEPGLLMNVFPNDDGSVSFNIFMYSADTGELMEDKCLAGTFVKDSGDPETNNIIYVSDQVSAIWITYDRTYYVKSYDESDYQIDQEFKIVDEITGDDESYYEDLDMVYLETIDEVFDFFGSVNNYGTRFRTSVPFVVINQHDFRSQLGYSIENHYYYIMVSDPKNTSKSFSVALYGYAPDEFHNRLWNEDFITFIGVLNGTDQNADFSVVAEQVFVN